MNIFVLLEGECLKLIEINFAYIYTNNVGLVFCDNRKKKCLAHIFNVPYHYKFYTNVTAKMSLSTVLTITT